MSTLNARLPVLIELLDRICICTQWTCFIHL